MANTNERIWLLLQDAELYKVVYRSTDRTLLVYNSKDDLLLTYSGITAEQLQQLEMLFAKIGAKKLDNRSEPFTYL